MEEIRVDMRERTAEEQAMFTLYYNNLRDNVAMPFINYITKVKGE